ncbi:MAG: methyltransferase [Pseudomonadota bacterium]
MKDLPPRLTALLYGYRASRILLSAVELDLFSALKGGATSEAVARKVRASFRGVEILLNALATLGLVRKKGRKFFNTKESAEFLAEGGASDWRLGLGHHFGLWESWSRLTEVAKRGRPQERLSRTRAETDSFIGLMHQLGMLRAPQLARALPLQGVRSVLDLGGGSGVYSIAIAKRKPDVRITLLDRPQVIPLTRRYVASAGVRENFTFLEGDLTQDRFGSGFDLALISSICHQFSPAENQAFLKKAARALNKGGRLAIHDFVLSDDRTSPVHAALFAVNMLVNTQGGNSYTLREYRDWLRRAGLKTVTFRRLSPFSDLVVARK